MAASATSHRPIKGILKKKSSADSAVLTTEQSGTPGPSTGAGTGAGSGEELSKKSQKWDEMSILATRHLVDKDYALMNIDEPSPQYHHMLRGDTEEDSISDLEIPQTMAPEFLAQRLAFAQGKEPKYLVRWGESIEDEEDLKRQFELKRKLHYSEGLNIKLARQLISKELLGDMEDEDPQDQEMREASDIESIETETSEKEDLADDNEDYDISKM
ncbi:protein phosphatase inhibitor 2-like [Antechinus flavipes]|uniref:protein phosphatase inhibitor 2-like n=1 Tax=Antechinus flavipes TaxID=38775 RepID=UPI0022357774|nr:protein phosphatase inhibitor 2-like [Antechinus flavipes]XP_051824525.1 protein phosphatase inhibitor 2-like [Antechinus flavipes]XP_051824526.1 protein phosphatase inhibitor 2-like [Antechinus flavipes]XP_051824527.1 protein phosphatase inhibitor 2-like [Antechinus flavipes]XP_051824528.1 protein phosphatase inhibitor 2-like [Antechinus flavipes]XP_051824529.1 protein phosphatase inhibitor 2-like [Antechinus flavipes]XP_051824530.1 protein phosphatase inhibitor 2-like [Antechinus flavipe